MRRIAKTLLLVPVLTLLIFQTPTEAAKAEPEPQVLTIASAAPLLFSALTDLVKAVLPKASDLATKLMNNKGSVKRDDLQKNIEAAQSETKTQVNLDVANLTKVADELDAIIKFNAPTSEARGELLKMKGTLRAFPTNEADRTKSWSELDTRLKAVQAKMQEISKVPDADLNHILDDSKRQQFKSLRDFAKGETFADLGSIITNKDVANLTGLNLGIDAIIDRVEFVTDYEGFEVSNLRDQLNSIKNIDVLKPAAPAPTPKPSETTQRFQRLANSQ